MEKQFGRELKKNHFNVVTLRGDRLHKIYHWVSPSGFTHHMLGYLGSIPTDALLLQNSGNGTDNPRV